MGKKKKGGLGGLEGRAAHGKGEKKRRLRMRWALRDRTST
jgi:hypothetical protein